MILPNSDCLDFRNLYFSLREPEEFPKVRFWRTFAEQSWFFPLGEKLAFRKENSVSVLILGNELPSPDMLNQEITARLEILPGMVDHAINQSFLDCCFTEEDFESRITPEWISIRDKAAYAGSRAMTKAEWQDYRNGGRLHTIVDLKEITFNPANKNLGLLFAAEWETFFGEHDLSLLIHGEKYQWGANQTYWQFPDAEAEGWFNALE